VVNGEWRMASGEWRVANGEWRMANGEWRVVNGEWRVASQRVANLQSLIIPVLFGETPDSNKVLT